MAVIADTGFTPVDHGVHAFDRSAFFIGHPFHIFGALNNDSEITSRFACIARRRYDNLSA
jgi:hypothetical protein